MGAISALPGNGQPHQSVRGHLARAQAVLCRPNRLARDSRRPQVPEMYQSTYGFNTQPQFVCKSTTTRSRSYSVQTFMKQWSIRYVCGVKVSKTCLIAWICVKWCILEVFRRIKKNSIPLESTLVHFMLDAHK